MHSNNERYELNDSIVDGWSGDTKSFSWCSIYHRSGYIYIFSLYSLRVFAFSLFLPVCLKGWCVYIDCGFRSLDSSHPIPHSMFHQLSFFSKKASSALHCFCRMYRPVGIVGLPNVGKSTLFNALTKSELAAMANYPFCTIDPNKANILAKRVHSSSLTPNCFYPRREIGQISFHLSVGKNCVRWDAVHRCSRVNQGCS